MRVTSVLDSSRVRFRCTPGRSDGAHRSAWVSTRQRRRVGLVGSCEFRDWRAQEIGRRLTKPASRMCFNAPAPCPTDGLISRTHFARYLRDNGHASDVRAVCSTSSRSAASRVSSADAGRA